MSYRIFKPNKGDKLQKYAVFDIETFKWVNPYYVGFFNGEVYKEFNGENCINDFLKESIRHKYRTFKIYAHNGGKFDFNFLVEKLKFSNRKVDFLMRGSTCVQLSVYHNNAVDEDGNLKSRNCTKFVDSYTLLPYALDKLTKDFNVEHKKLNFMDNQKDKKDYQYLYELYKQRDKRFTNYAKNDCLGLYEVIKKFYNLIEKENGDVGLTLASTSLKTFKKSCLKHSLKMTTQKVNDEMKLGYYGGRTEIFKMYLPDGKYYCYDVNSLYPYVMRNNEFPITTPILIKNPSKTMVLESYGITKCRVKAPDNLDIPLLPYRFKNKLYFPIGIFEGYWDNSLLKKADELGYKIYPEKMFTFETGKIFKEYVDKFYSLKQKSVKDTAPYIIAKLLLNSLYGKFAQSQDSDMIMKIPDINKKDLEIIDVIDFDYGLYKVKSESKGTHFIPQISIHVTALSQLELYSHFEKIKDKGGFVAYCDTDSLFTDIKLPISNKLGDLGLEYKFMRGYFLLPKTYYVVLDKKNKVKAKGFIKDFQDKLTESSYKKALLKNDYSDFVMESEDDFNTMKTSYRRHHTFISVDKRKKSIKHKYDKRKIIKDYNTKPKNIKDIIKE